MNVRRWLGLREGSSLQATSQRDELERLRARCADLEERLRLSEERLRERTASLYELQKQYSTEHFGLHESMRSLKIERMRNAGAYAGLQIVLERARTLQARIAELKRRLRDYERVEDRYEDDAPVVLEDEQG
jgi:nucleotidyltransferase/DNA polymerase involved in DNA repair